MLYILFSAVILIPVFMGIGEFFAKSLKIFSDGIAMKLLVGIFAVSVVFTVAAFFIPLNITVEIPVLFIGIAGFFYFKLYENCRDFLTRNKMIFPLLVLITFFFGSFPPFILDHFGYYVPTIKWISEVGLVRGISNLDLLLGQMSVWHIFQAGFSHFSDPFLRMNVILLIVYLIYIVEKKHWIHLVFLPFLFLFSQSPSPDLPVIVVSLIVLTEVFSHNKNVALLFAFSAFVFAIKPTLIWLLMLCFLYAVFITKAHLRFVIPGILVLFLFVVKNIYTFGFPVFPAQFFDLGISWKPNAALLKTSSEMALLKTYDLQFTYPEIENFTTFQAIKNWIFLNGIKSKIHILFILSLLVFFAFALKKQSKLIWLVFVSVLVKSILVVLFSAQYRFFIDVFFVIFWVMFYQRISRQISFVLFSAFSLFFAALLCFPAFFNNHLPSFRLTGFMGEFQKEQFAKPFVYHWQKFKTHTIGNLTFHITEDYPYNFETPIPAISPEFVQQDFDTGIFPQLKGKTLKDGFIWKKLTEQEKNQVQQILDNLNRKTENSAQ